MGLLNEKKNILYAALCLCVAAILFSSHILSVRAQTAESFVDVLWSAHSYVPPFYKGKALAPSRGYIVFTAIPNLVTSAGTSIDPDSIIYTWSSQGVILSDSSGRGKSRLVLGGEGSPLRPTTVAVTVTSPGGSLKAEKIVRVPVSPQVIVFYEKRPLEGIAYEAALGRDVSLIQNEVTVRAEPYYFSLDDVAAGKMKYDWRLDNNPVTPFGDDIQEITLRRNDDGAGQARVGLFIGNTNLDKVLQEATSGFTIHF